MQARPEIVRRRVGVPHDRICPVQRRTLATGVLLDVDCVRVRDVREAELLHDLIDDTALQHLRFDERPAFARTVVQRERVGGSEARAHSAAAFRPPRPTAGSSSWPTPHVLITRCWPYVTA